MLASGDPIAEALWVKYGTVNVPNLALGEPQVTAVLDYLDAQSRAGDRARLERNARADRTAD